MQYVGVIEINKNIEVIVCASEEGNKMMCVNMSKTNKKKIIIIKYIKIIKYGIVCASGPHH